MQDEHPAITVIQRFYEAEAAYLTPGGGDFEALAATPDPECVLHQPASLPYGGEWRGPAEFARWLQAFSTQWSSLEVKDPEFTRLATWCSAAPMPMPSRARATRRWLPSGRSSCVLGFATKRGAWQPITSGEHSAISGQQHGGQGTIPVSPVGTLTIGSSSATSGLTLNGTLNVDLVGGGTTAGVNNDEISVSGTLRLNPISSQLVIGSVSNRTGLSVGQTFYLVLDSGITPVVGTFGNALQGGTIMDSDGDTFTVSYLANGDGGTLGNDVSLTVASLAATVPEPSTWVLLGLGADLLGLTMRQRSLAA